MNYQETTLFFASIMKDFENNLSFKNDKESLKNTPNRLSKMYLDELLQGYTQNPKEILSKKIKTTNNEMIIIKDISFASLCAHHWLPFMGKVHVGYIPNDKQIVGLSKISQTVDCFARRFQIQENMTTQIADAIYKYVNPKGVIVLCKAEHLCAQIRGVQTKETKMITSALRGCFEKPDIKNEFLTIINS